MSRMLSRPMLAILVCLITPVSSVATVAPTSIEELTLAYLYNFLKFTEWPAADTINEMNICVTKGGKLIAYPDSLASHLAQNRKVAIRPVEAAQDLHFCQLLFLDQGENNITIGQWLKHAEKLPILTVSDKPEFLEMGGMITLIENDNRLQFEVDLISVRNAGLSLNSQVLKITRDVRGK